MSTRIRETLWLVRELQLFQAQCHDQKADEHALLCAKAREDALTCRARAFNLQEAARIVALADGAEAEQGR
jgi:hypothetical protein